MLSRFCFSRVCGTGEAFLLCGVSAPGSLWLRPAVIPFQYFSPPRVVCPVEVELLEWRTSVEGYIEEIRREKDPAVRERLMQEYDARAYGSRITRLESLNGSIDTELSRLYARANEQFRQLLGENYTDGYYQAIYDIQSRYGYSSAFATVNSKVVENALTYPWSGANFSDRLWKHKFELLNQLRETLTTGLIRGESVQDMSKRLAERMNASRSNALRLIRTESSHIHNTAELDAYKACGFEEYEYMASFGERTCDVCGGLDGQRFKLSEKQPGVNFPPLHPNCRCTTVAVDPDDDLEDLKSGELDYEQWYQKYVGGRTPEKLEYRQGAETAVPRGQPVPVMSGGAQNSAGQSLTKRVKSDIIITDKQRGKKFGKHCSDWGLDPSAASDREKLEDIIHDIVLSRDEIRIGKFNGQANNVIFYIKGEDVVITNQNNEFVTVMKGGITDGWVKDARRL